MFWYNDFNAMKSEKIVLLFIIILSVCKTPMSWGGNLSAPGGDIEKPKVHTLKVNHLVAPIGVDDNNPRFNWISEGFAQKGGRISVGTDSMRVASMDGNIWNANLNANGVNGITYAGPTLEPSTVYYWKVSGDGWASPLGTFETGLKGNWKGNWISDNRGCEYEAAPYFRKEFEITKAVKSARAYIAAGGLFNMSINGDRVGNQMLTPVYTRYDRTCKYLTFDITSMLTQGGNAVGVILGNGWYNHQAKAVWNFDKAPWRDRPAFCMELKIEYADGSVESVVTDLTWRTTSETPYTYNNLYTGEHYDFNMELHGWNEYGFDDSSWSRVRLRSAPAPVVSSQQMSPIRPVRKVKATDFKQLDDSTFVYDFGYNMSGAVEMNVKGDKGTMLKVSHGERIYDNGYLNPSNIDVYYTGNRETEPFQTDIITLDGNENRFMPEFSYKGFRYIQVTSSRPVNLSRDAFAAWEIHSDVASVGGVKSSNPLLDAMVDAARNAYISNLMGYPTDCPQREKNGWTGDGHLAIETAFYNFDGITVYEKWLSDHRDEQQPNGVLPDIIPTGGWGYGTDNGLDWTSTIAIIPWNIYLFYGDERPLRECYGNIKRYVDYVDHNSPSHLSSWGRGDWVPVKTRSDKELIASIYFFADATILSKAARLFGYNDDEEKYSILAGNIRDAINRKFLNQETGIYAGGSQTEMSLPLMWGVVPEDFKEIVAANLAKTVEDSDFHLDVGVHGAKALLNALSENGYTETAYKVAVQDTYPSWGWWIVNGATSLLENWNLDATRDISDNHIMFGEIGAWPYKGLGGIYPDEKSPGFKHIILKPGFPVGLDEFDARHKSPYGEIVSGWTTKGQKIIYSVTVPDNTTATLHTPAGFKGYKKHIDLNPGKHIVIFERIKK